jgi:AraC-like DNA-binding protein
LRLADNVTLDELAQATGLERFALLRAFARSYGLPPHAWVIQERVRRAQALLRSGASPAAAAVEVGFADQSHLSRHFRRLTGLTPGCYRRGAVGR